MISPASGSRGLLAGDARHGGRSPVGDIEWLKTDGSVMDEGTWNSGFVRSLMVFLNGDAIPEPDPRGERVVDDSFLIAFNAHHETLTFTIPDEVYGEGWLVALDTSDDEAGSVSVFDDATTLIPGVDIGVAGRCVLVLRRPRQASR